jgi:hypothetical protein
MFSLQQQSGWQQQQQHRTRQLAPRQRKVSYHNPNMHKVMVLNEIAGLLMLRWWCLLAECSLQHNLVLHIFDMLVRQLIRYFRTDIQNAFSGSFIVETRSCHSGDRSGINLQRSNCQSGCINAYKHLKHIVELALAPSSSQYCL